MSPPHGGLPKKTPQHGGRNIELLAWIGISFFIASRGIVLGPEDVSFAYLTVGLWFVPLLTLGLSKVCLGTTLTPRQRIWFGTTMGLSFLFSAYILFSKPSFFLVNSSKALFLFRALYYAFFEAYPLVWFRYLLVVRKVPLVSASLQLLFWTFLGIVSLVLFLYLKTGIVPTVAVEMQTETGDSHATMIAVMATALAIFCLIFVVIKMIELAFVRRFSALSISMLLSLFSKILLMTPLQTQPQPPVLVFGQMLFIFLYATCSFVLRKEQRISTQ